MLAYLAVIAREPEAVERALREEEKSGRVNVAAHNDVNRLGEAPGLFNALYI